MLTDWFHIQHGVSRAVLETESQSNGQQRCYTTKILIVNDYDICRLIGTGKFTIN